ncbi:sulfonate ABC transporter substrate-binding protein [Effusibacillus pohliae]|uniref:sulfonate ABC transporter substrate-binding protein n=1 Tax=Effusibacillus pohliae TaxID=232270 RepID=UPI000371D319|nr:sulfonate ABC transporter substrate-binding protein [Effusibacillus pohliae]
MRMHTDKKRLAARWTMAAAIGLLALFPALTGCGTGERPVQGQPASPGQTSGKDAQHVVRIGYQKYGTLNLLKSKGNLEKRLASLGYSVQWLLFPAGPQLLEALNAGSIDLGHTGESPPIFAQAAGTPLVYVANEPASPEAEAILVKGDSSIRSVADLKGKKVALNKGSNVHYLLVKVLEKSGLQIADIQPVYLPPADARAAFERGSVDAWVIWDPFYAAAQQATGARVLADGTNLVANREFYLASQSFVKEHSDIITVVLEEVKKVDEWAKQDPHGVAAFLSPELGIDIASLEQASKRRSYGIEPVGEQVLADQQKIADTFFGIGLIPKQISVRDALFRSNR